MAAQLRCLYSSAHSLGNQQEEVEASVVLENCDIAAVTELWWDKSHVQLWMAVQKGQGRKERQWGALCIKRWIEHEELFLKTAMSKLKACG